jgi:chromosome partitioning protein
LKYLDAPIKRRKSLATSAGKGISVLEFSPKDQKAIEEMQTLVDMIFIS